MFRTPDADPIPQSTASTPSPQSSTTITNLSGKQLSQSYNIGTNGRSSLNVGLSTQTTSLSPSNKTTRYRPILILFYKRLFKTIFL